MKRIQRGFHGHTLCPSVCTPVFNHPAATPSLPVNEHGGEAEVLMEITSFPRMSRIVFVKSAGIETEASLHAFTTSPVGSDGKEARVFGFMKTFTTTARNSNQENITANWILE